MKTVRFASVIFLILLIAVTLNSIAIGNIISDLTEKLTYAEEENMAAAKDEYELIYKKYKSYEMYISLTVSHDDLANLEDAFAEIIGAAKAGDRDGVITTKYRLINCLGHIKRLSGINIYSVF